VNGKDGAPGQTGLNGKDGAPGQTGLNGKDGAPGKAGKDGAQGPQGPKGPAGTADTVVLTASFSDGAETSLDCPPDHPVAIGGGVAPGNSNNTVRYTTPAMGTDGKAHGWRAGTKKTGNSDNGQSTVYTICGPAAG
jgi:hypothetical protein